MRSNKELSDYRLEKAEKCLNLARKLLNEEEHEGAANRSYYCIFHCMRSIFALEPIDFKKHSAAIAYFRRTYIKSGKFGDVGKRLSNIISDLFELRGDSDYEDFYIISKQEVAEQVENAEYFLEQIKAYLAKQGI